MGLLGTEAALETADVAVNPMLTGSGTNLKMLDYMAAGIPVITTRVGARGLDIPDGCVVQCDLEHFDHYLHDFEARVDVEKSRAYVRDKFAWDVIGAGYHRALLNGLGLGPGAGQFKP